MFSAGTQLLQCIGTRRIQQTIMRAVAANIRENERLCHQPGKLADHIADVLASNSNHCIELELAGEYAELPEQPRLVVRQEVVAPVERCA